MGDGLKDVLAQLQFDIARGHDHTAFALSRASILFR
jgi:hypothetical protein